MTTYVDEKIVAAISERAREMQASPLRKLAAIAEQRKKKGITVYHLNIGQPDLPTAPEVFDTVKHTTLKTLAYAPSNGLPETLSAWKKYYGHYGISISEQEMIVTAGGSEAITFAMYAICDPEDEIIVFEPFYTNYNGFASLANVRLRPVPLSISNGFHLPPDEEIEKRIGERTRGILICNPSNPTGTIFTKQELDRIVAIAEKHSLFVISDEVYREFAYDAPHYSILSYESIRDKAILVDSTSKRFNVCGARIGVLACRNPEIIQSVLKFGMARLSVATLEQLAVVPLLSDPEPYVTPIVKEFRSRRDIVYDALGNIPGVTYYKPEGAFYIVIGLPVDDADEFCRWLIESYDDNGETVLIAPANGFYASPGVGVNEVRLAFMLKASHLHRSLDIIAKGLSLYRNQ